MTDPKDTPLASLGLLRRLTDRHVIEQLLLTEAMTRAELAAATGISKPTVSESIRRLAADGVVCEVGEATAARRGPAGVNYALRPDLGVALAVAAGPDGLVAGLLDVRGRVVRQITEDVTSPVTAAELGPALEDLVDRAIEGAVGAVRSCCLSLAGPVDRETGRLRHFPYSPFLVDELDPRALLASRIEVPIHVDNDVNWAALAELHADGAQDTDFCYLHLGYGLGGALISNGQLMHGHTGVAGEPAQMITVGPGGRAMRLVECFGELGLLRPGSNTIDVSRVVAALEADDRSVRQAIVDAVVGAVASMAALLNPARVVIGGPWAGAGDLIDSVREVAAHQVVPPTSVVAATTGTATAPLLGTRLAAVTQLREALFGVIL